MKASKFNAYLKPVAFTAQIIHKMSSLLQNHTPHVRQDEVFVCERVKNEKETLNTGVRNEALKAFVPGKRSAYVIFDLDAIILKASISNKPLCVHGELQHFLPNDIGSSEP